MDLYTKPNSGHSQSSDSGGEDNHLPRAANVALDGASPAFDRTLPAADGVVNELSHTASSMARSISDQAVRVRDASYKGVDVTRSYVRDKPMRSVAMAASVGFLVGLLLRLR